MTTPDPMAAARTLALRSFELSCESSHMTADEERAWESGWEAAAQAIAAHTAQIVREREDYKMWFEEERLSRQRERAQAVAERDDVDTITLLPRKVVPIAQEYEQKLDQQAEEIAHWRRVVRELSPAPPLPVEEPYQ